LPGTNLTRIEAAERAELLTVSDYHVRLDLSGTGATFTSETTVKFTATPGSATFIDLIAPEVRRVVLNGRELDPAEIYRDARIHLHELAERNELHVVASCAYMTTGEGLHRFTDPVDEETYLYSQFEVADARRVFAVFDQPDLKARFTFTVTAPEHWQVISNSPAPEPVKADDGAATWSFDPTPRLPCYVTAIIAGPYHRVSDELTSSDGRTIPLGVFCRASLAEHLDADRILEVTKAGFAFFEEAFDYPYPYAKYDQLFVPEFNAGAMENAGAVTFLENYVFRSAVPDALVERRTVTILHEMAHMWFGDLVTMRWWNDLWLNESFAEYASMLATAEATEWTEAWTTFAALEKSWAYRQDQLPTTHPIVAQINDLQDVLVNFDGITYAKGASVLKQLAAWVGRDAFLSGVRSYFRKHAWGNTELGDLLTELEAPSGRDLRDWSQVWLEEAGVTLLRPQIETDYQGRITTFHITQEAPESHPALRPHRIAVGLYTLTDGGDLERTHRFEVDIAGAATPVPELVGLDSPTLILLNDDDLAYAKVRLDERSLANAVNHVKDFTDSLPRALIWGATWDMTRDGEWPAARFIDLVLNNIGAETNSSVLMVLLRQLTTATSYVDPAHRQATEARVADRLWDHALEAEQGSDAQLQLLKTFATFAATPGQQQTLQGLLDGSVSLPGLIVDTDLRWELLTALVSTGAAGGEEIEAELRRDPTATGQRAAAAARAAVPTTSAKEQVWADAITPDRLPNAVQRAVIAGFNRVKDRSLLAPFARRYFEVIEQVWNDHTHEMAQNVVVGLYPHAVADIDRSAGVDVSAATEEFLARLGDDTPALRRLVVESADEVRRALHAQRVDRAART